MSRLIPETNETVQETANVNLPKVERDGGTSGIAFAIVFHDAMDEIDALLASFDPMVITGIQTDITDLQNDVSTLQTDLGNLQTQVNTNTTNIGTNVTNIAQNATDIAELQNTKEDAAVRATVSNMTYDIEGNLTSYDDGLFRFQNPVYVNNELQSFEQVVNGNTTTVTLNVDVDENLESIDVV